MRNVDPAVVDAARGMGMREREVLVKAELPIALPLMLGGLRTATLQVIATAAIGAYIGLGGLGRLLIDGLALNDYPRMVAGAVLIAALALVVEGLLALAQRLIVSPGLRTAPTRTASADPPQLSQEEPHEAHTRRTGRSLGAGRHGMWGRRRPAGRVRW
ncbi:hypothetical protein BJF78_27850 [Pseudonocardia sp. CNS-139]|nr:hypothetical protein BJF78_27850 [Pseudonocardia sp. CNS-139]